MSSFFTLAKERKVHRKKYKDCKESRRVKKMKNQSKERTRIEQENDSVLLKLHLKSVFLPLLASQFLFLVGEEQRSSCPLVLSFHSSLWRKRRTRCFMTWLQPPPSLLSRLNDDNRYYGWKGSQEGTFSLHEWNREQEESIKNQYKRNSQKEIRSPEGASREGIRFWCIRRTSCKTEKMFLSALMAKRTWKESSKEWKMKREREKRNQDRQQESFLMESDRAVNTLMLLCNNMFVYRIAFIHTFPCKSH